MTRSVSSCSATVKGELSVFFSSSASSAATWPHGHSANNLFRYKGVLAVKGFQEKFVFQGVHMLFAGSFSDTHSWAEGEERECRFKFIGKNLDKAQLIKDFEACKAEDIRRFTVGDKVLAAYGSFVEGKVLKTWDEGNAHRIEVQDEDPDEHLGADRRQHVREAVRPRRVDGRRGSAGLAPSFYLCLQRLPLPLPSAPSLSPPPTRGGRPPLVPPSPSPYTVQAL